MQPFPHHYAVITRGQVEGAIELRSQGLPVLRSASPAEFGGPGDLWSPETFLVGAIGDCLILTFRSIARASNLAWLSLDCDVAGTLERVDRVTKFTAFEVRATLRVPDGVDVDRARQLLEKAEHSCLITSSLSGTVRFDPVVEAAVPVSS